MSKIDFRGPKNMINLIQNRLLIKVVRNKAEHEIKMASIANSMSKQDATKDAFFSPF